MEVTTAENIWLDKPAEHIEQGNVVENDEEIDNVFQ